MFKVVRTDEFDQWITQLKDIVGRRRLLSSINRLAHGNPGDVKP